MKLIATALIATFAIASAAQAASKAPDVCQLSINGMASTSFSFVNDNGAGFFQAANQLAVQNGTCIYAKIDSMPESGRVYNRTGQLMPDYSGKKRNLSNSEAREAQSRADSECQVASCIPIVDNKAPQYEQDARVPEVELDRQPTPQTIEIPAQPDVQMGSSSNPW